MPHTARRTAPQENFNTEVAMGLVPSSGVFQLLKFFTRRYGQLAFGVLTLLIIYQVMLKPMLADQKVDVAALREVAISMRDTAESNRTVAQNLRLTAEILDRVTKRIDALPR